jgi:hypothetical protein
MAKKTFKKKGWPEIGQIVENKTKDGKKFRSVKFNDNVQILVDGEEIEMNQYRQGTLVDPVKEVEQLIERGIISEDKAEERMEQVQEVSNWLKFKIVVPRRAARLRTAAMR